MVPSLADVLPEVLVVVSLLVLVEVVEHLHLLVIAVIENVRLPLFRIENSVKHLSQVLHVLHVFAEAFGNPPLLIFECMNEIVVRGKFFEARPVTVLLALGAECGTHADPVLIFVT